MTDSGLVIQIRVVADQFKDTCDRLIDASAFASFAVDKLVAVMGGWPDPFFILSRYGRTTRFRKITSHT